MISPSTNLIRVLQAYAGEFARLVPFDLNIPQLLIFDLSESNPVLNGMDFTENGSFNEYIFSEMRKANSPVAIGKYDEDRVIYRQSENFQGIESRSIHIGIDIWAEAGTAVFSPLNGTVHSFRNNTGFGNYGPTVILAHQLEGISFYTLFGHLNQECLQHLYPGKSIKKGDLVGKMGEISENGQWPPHLHFQIITDMLHWHGDFPGVAAPSQKTYFLQLCPDPNLILQIKKLQSINYPQ